MYIVLVHVDVKEGEIEAFKKASLINAENSVLEPGIKRFDVIQELENPNRFILVEVYLDEQAAISHKGTQHYADWRDRVAGMMASPRTGVKFCNIFPGEDGW